MTVTTELTLQRNGVLHLAIDSDGPTDTGEVEADAIYATIDPDDESIQVPENARLTLIELTLGQDTAGTIVVGSLNADEDTFTPLTGAMPISQGFHLVGTSRNPVLELPAGEGLAILTTDATVAGYAKLRVRQS